MSDNIFVFGSNMSGIHGAGAAAHAHRNLGAKYGVGEGMTGECYALPTKGRRIECMPLHWVKKKIENFIRFAEDHPELSFQVTRVGCGLGGFKDEQIAPLFENAPSNCLFDTKWRKFLPKNKQFWGTF